MVQVLCSCDAREGQVPTKRRIAPGPTNRVPSQSDDRMLSTLLVAPTFKSVSARSFRPTITINRSCRCSLNKRSS